jgi:solute carrier family 35 protein E1
VLLCLVPIIGGVVGASFTEATFNWVGFSAAIGSSLSLCFRNVLSKKFMTPEVKEELGGSIGLFSLITLMAFCLLAPIAVLVEGVQLTPAAMATMGVDSQRVLFLSTIAALTFHAYQQTSYMVLSRVVPMTHSIGNCVKRVVVIVASVVVFQNPMSAQSMWSTAFALSGVFAYSQAKRITAEWEKAKAV